jgi:hypothetical protein
MGITEMRTEINPAVLQSRFCRTRNPLVILYTRTIEIRLLRRNRVLELSWTK